MSWMPSDDPALGDPKTCDALELIIVPRTRDLGDGFAVRRALPHGNPDHRARLTDADFRVERGVVLHEPLPRRRDSGTSREWCYSRTCCPRQRSSSRSWIEQKVWNTDSQRFATSPRRSIFA